MDPKANVSTVFLWRYGDHNFITGDHKSLQRVVKGISISSDWLISVRVKCLIMFSAPEASFSIKLLREMRIIGVKLLNYESIVQIRVKILRRPFRGRYILDDYTYSRNKI